MRLFMFAAVACLPLFLSGCASSPSLCPDCSSSAGLADLTTSSIAPPEETSAPPAPSSPVLAEAPAPPVKLVRVADDRGGYVIAYAAKMMRWREDKTQVRFSGACESACTLYLALPADQICITPGASFHFHAPMASQSRNARVAENYMLSNYPDWVTSWIDEHGGLSSRMITMNYDYARKFIKDCAPELSAQRVASR